MALLVWSDRRIGGKDDSFYLGIYIGFAAGDVIMTAVVMFLVGSCFGVNTRVFLVPLALVTHHATTAGEARSARQCGYA